MPVRSLWIAGLWVWATAASVPSVRAAETQSPETIIVTAPGDAADMDDAVLLAPADLKGLSGPNLLRALGGQVAGLSLSDVQGNAFQPDIVYRGFSASPLQGNAQGLAVYLDGGRFNLPFGDTVAMDLLPDTAVNSLSLRDNNPIFGLNALGGAVVIATHTGRSAPGLAAGVSAGDHGRRGADAAYGVSNGAYSFFLAGQAEQDGGWRAYSPAKLAKGFADLGWEDARSGVHLKLMGAKTNLVGNGSAPVDLLAADRAAVFTHPDQTRNQLWRASLHPWVAIGPDDRLEASLYAQSFRQRTRNGDLADIAPCEDAQDLLCLESAGADDAPLIDVAGLPIAAQPIHLVYGVFNRTATRSRGGGLVGQYVRGAPLFGHANRLTLGLSHDRASSQFAAESELGVLSPDRAVLGLGSVIHQPDRAIAPIAVAVRTRATGLFLWNDLQLDARLSAEISLRWNDVRINMDDRIGTDLTGRHRFQRLNPGLELDYRLLPAATLRLGYAETSRAPTPAELSCADEAAPCSLTNFFVADPPLDQVVAKSWEAGALGQWRFGGWQGQWSLALYRTDIANDLLLTAAQTRGRAFFRNIGQSRRDGLDVSLRARRAAWSVALGYAYSRAQFRAPFIAISPQNPAADDAGRIAIAAGAQLPGIPRHRGVANLDYQDDTLTFGVRLQAQSGQQRRGDEGNADARVRGFFRADLGAGLKLGHGLSAFVDITNVFNRRYATFGTYSETDAIDLAEAPDATDPRADTPGAPRRVLIGLRLQH